MQQKEKGMPALLKKLRTDKRLRYAAYGLAALAAVALYAAGTDRFTSAARASPTPAVTETASSDALEQRLSEVLARIRGVGKVDVLIAYETEGTAQGGTTVRGVIVVAEGAALLSVRKDLQNAVRAATDLPISKIEVFEMASEPYNTAAE